MSHNDFSLAQNPNRKPMDPNRMGGDAAALASMLSLVNNPELELLNQVSPDVVPGAEKLTVQTQEDPPKSKPAVIRTMPLTPTPTPNPTLKRPVGRALLFSGRLATGKDFVAEKAEATIFGFADPMYQVASYFFGVEVTSTKNKDLPGMRQFLQYLGQWGRNEVNDKYPYTPARATFVQMIRALGSKFDKNVNWANYGIDKNLWVQGCDARVESFRAENPNKRVAITNARFENELMYFREHGWDHWHVMCSPETWAERLAKKNLKPDAKELVDISEQLAMHLDRDVQRKIAAKRVGDKLRVIWNDHRPAPSNRLFTLNEFLQEVAIAESSVGIPDDQA